jgi:hypothetical protein
MARTAASTLGTRWAGCAMMVIRTAMALLVTMFLASTPALAVEHTFTAKLDGASQVPKVDSKATGEATFTVSADGRKIAYTLRVRELADTTMAHIHIGSTGRNGPVAVWLYPTDGKPALIKGVKSGELARGEITEASLQGPEKGKPLSALVKAMRDGDAYVNVHTAEHKDGEIRGQIISSR